MIRAGETFVWCGNAFKQHLYIAMNDSESFGGKIAVLNITESTGGAAAFVLRKGDHPFIYKNSDVNFGDAFIAEEQYLCGEIKCRSAVPQENMDLKIVRKIAEVASKHPAPPNEVKEIIKAYWNL